MSRARKRAKVITRDEQEYKEWAKEYKLCYEQEQKYHKSLKGKYKFIDHQTIRFLVSEITDELLAPPIRKIVIDKNVSHPLVDFRAIGWYNNSCLYFKYKKKVPTSIVIHELTHHWISKHNEEFLKVEKQLMKLSCEILE